MATYVVTWWIAALVIALVVLLRPASAGAHAVPSDLCSPDSSCSQSIPPGETASVEAAAVTNDSRSDTLFATNSGIVLSVTDDSGAGLRIEFGTTASCRHRNSLPEVSDCSEPRGAIKLVTTPPNPGGPCQAATLAAGWNLLSGSVARLLTTNDGDLYTLSANRGAYEQIAPAQVVDATHGYWAYFAAQTAAFVGCAAPLPIDISGDTVSVTVPAGWSMIGNGLPVLDSALLTGADSAYSYDVQRGAYKQTSILPPGQGAGVYTSQQAVVVLSPVPRS